MWMSSLLSRGLLSSLLTQIPLQKVFPSIISLLFAVLKNLTLLTACGQPLTVATKLHLLKFLEKLRWLSFYNQNGSPRHKPLALIGFSTDSAGFSLHASVISMTPTERHVKEGVFFLRLGIQEERFVTPYYSSLPFISFLDWDHERRLFAKCLKYETLDMTLERKEGSLLVDQHPAS